MAVLEPGWYARRISPTSDESMRYLNSCTVVPCHELDGRVVNVPMAELDDYLAKRKIERKAERRRTRKETDDGTD